MRSAIALCLALLAAVPLAAGAHETVKPLFHRALPNVPGKALVAVEVSFAPGAEAAPRVYRTGESWYEDPGARHQVTRNPSKDKPAKLLAVFVLDEGEQKLVLPAAK